MSNLRYFGWSRPLRPSRALSPTPTCESEIYDSSVPNSRHKWAESASMKTAVERWLSLLGMASSYAPAHLSLNMFW